MDDAQPHRQQPIRFEFTGSGSEYFRIWIVNLLLTLLTLSVYSAWAKVRREKYFHQSTRLAGASFDYHGRPLPILLGRVVAICLLALTQLAAFDATVAMVAWALVLALLPWLMLRSAQFRLANTSYRGLRFRLAATPKLAYRTFGGYLAVALLAMALVVSGAGKDLRAASGSFFVLLFLMYPLLSASWRKFVVNHGRYGDLSFALPLRKRDVVRTYLRASGLAFGLLLLLSLVAGAALWVLSLPGGILAEFGGKVIALVTGLTAYAIYFAVRPLVTARLQNLCWNATSAVTRPLTNLQIEHKFASDLKPSRYALRSVRNGFLVILTLGLFRPFAMIDLARRRITAISLIPDASLDTVLSELNVDGPSAVGSEAVDLLGFDISL